MSIGSRIKECRENVGITQEELAKLLGVSKGAIGNYESGASYPKIENMTKLFEILKTDANYLFQDETSRKKSDMFSETEKKHIKKYRTLDGYGKKAVDDLLNTEYERCISVEEEKTLPVFTFKHFSINKASAGCGYDLNNADIWQDLEVVDTPEARGADFAVEIDGHSMEPTYQDGDIVYIVKALEVPEGKVGLFIQNGKGYIKEAGKNCLISHNPDYPDVYPKDGRIECIGRVIGVAELL